MAFHLNLVAHDLRLVAHGLYFRLVKMNLILAMYFRQPLFRAR